MSAPYGRPVFGWQGTPQRVKGRPTTPASRRKGSGDSSNPGVTLPGLISDPLVDADLGLVNWLYWWRAGPEANAWTGVCAVYRCKPTHNVLKFCRSEISDCFLIQSELVQLLHIQVSPWCKLAHAGISNFRIDGAKRAQWAAEISVCGTGTLNGRKQ